MKLIAYKGAVTIDPASIAVPEMRRLLKDLESILNDQTLYDKVCVFIFLISDLSNDNPIVDRPYDSKRIDALELAFGQDLNRFMALRDNNELIRDLVTECINIYLRDVNTDEQKDIATYSKKMDQFRNMLHGMKPRIEKNTNDINGMITYSTNMEIINSVLRDIVNLIQAKASLIALHTTGAIPKHLRGKLSVDTQGQLMSDIEIDLPTLVDETEEDTDE